MRRLNWALLTVDLTKYHMYISCNHLFNKNEICFNKSVIIIIIYKFITLTDLLPLKMNYYLAGKEATKKQLIKALNQYARDRSIEQLAQSLKGILRTPVERKLLGDIRYNLMLSIKSSLSQFSLLKVNKHV